MAGIYTALVYRRPSLKADIHSLYSERVNNNTLTDSFDAKSIVRCGFLNGNDRKLLL